MEDLLPEDRPTGAKTIHRKPAWLECQARKVEDECVKGPGSGGPIDISQAWDLPLHYKGNKYTSVVSFV